MATENRVAGPVTVDAEGAERVWRAGKLPPMKIRKLPEAPAAAHVLGPAMILIAIGVGFGETYLWPRLVIVFGPDIRWLFTVGVLVQTVVMLEMARYAMATGESIFFGAARVWQPLMWMFFAIAALVYIWPGHISAGAESLEEITGISWQASATVALIVIGIMFTVVRFVYNFIEGLLAIAVGVMVIGSAIVGAFVGSLHDLGVTLAGTVRVDTWIPSEAFTAAFFPVVVGALAFAGPSGMQQMWYTLWLRDKGAVMGLNAADLNPDARTALLEGDRDAALPAMGDAFEEAAGFFDTLFFIFIAIVGFKASVGLFDAFARGQSDMTYYFLPGAKRLKMAHLYGLYLWFVIIFGIIILNFGPADGPTGILDILAFLSAFVMGAYCLTLAVVNNKNLPKKLRPHWAFTVVLVLGGIGYLTAIMYSVIKYGVSDIG